MSFQRNKRTTAHYRPVSTILLDPPLQTSSRDLFKPRSRLSLRPTISDFSPSRTMSALRQSDRNYSSSTEKLPTITISHSASQRGEKSPSPPGFLRRARRRSSLSLLLRPTEASGDPERSKSPRPKSSSVSSAEKSPSRSPPSSISTAVYESPPVSQGPRPAKVIYMDNWIRRENSTLHPYTDEAPYMQAYDPVLLDNDRYTDILLRRLAPKGSPTFHDYGKRPPKSILDLGCGFGDWILTAAEIWKTSQFIGYDLVDLTSHIQNRPDNVQFIRGNFLKQRLPFPNKQFDLIRMANLSLCIPHAKWEPLLAEVFRILDINGRLELIDDQILFPYGPTPRSAPTPSFRPAPTRGLYLDDDWDDEDILEDLSRDSDSTLFSDKSSCDIDEKLHQDIELKPVRFHSGDSKQKDSMITRSSFPDTSTWFQQAAQCQNLETLFQDMLHTQYGVHSRPCDFLADTLQMIFGRGNARKSKSFHLKLAPPDANTFYGFATGSSGSGSSKETLHPRDDKSSTHSSDSGLGFPSNKKPWIHLEWDWEKKDRKDSFEKAVYNFPSNSIPEGVSAKAAGRLGITYSALAAATAASTRHHIQSAQSPGLILWPSTYFPMSPSELEMHTCKHLHVLLGCKHAISDYLRVLKDEDGTKFISDHALNDLLWEYECFRRRRFHWPSDNSDICFDAEDETSTFKGLSRPPSWGSDSSTKISSESSIYPYSKDELTHVRTIRVYSAVKIDDYSLATLQYPRYPAPLPPKRLS
ncbi:hypothetical protein AMATHDRAFT_57336 [Amanita thiersii Skay4041]|uniref:Methyltransferase domain-containing protein n=1 Tax=Amanita thiersii Skay4041 TaxID=703135 RepID=A0A2A9NWX5_9AGAR|nr:hypothetical protein AMATHDRAFT_57336 [Amanita thiersii Skay4041]